MCPYVDRLVEPIVRATGRFRIVLSYGEGLGGWPIVVGPRADMI